MLTPNALLRIIFDALSKTSMPDIAFLYKAELTSRRWYDLRSGRRPATLLELIKMSEAVGLSVQLVEKHHAPFMQLSSEEAVAVLKLAEHYKRNGPPQAHPLRTAVEKLTSTK